MTSTFLRRPGASGPLTWAFFAGAVCIAPLTFAADSPAFAKPNLTPTGVRSLAASCASCHRTSASADAGGALTSLATLTALAGMDKSVFVDRMTAYREGKRTATVMHQLAKGFNDAEIDALGTFFAAQKR